MTRFDKKKKAQEIELIEANPDYPNLKDRNSAEICSEESLEELSKSEKKGE